MQDCFARQTQSIISVCGQFAPMALLATTFAEEL
jgi:hypothetical protein